MRKPQIFAHRGARVVAPENTLPAFEKALAMGVDGIELDVQASKDGKLVVMHDFTVKKTTNGRGRVASMTYAKLSTLDAGSHFDPRFAGTPIPTLDQVFDLVGNRCSVNVEIKTNHPSGGDEVDLLLPILQQRKLYDQVIVSSFNIITLIRMRATAPKVALGLLYYLPMPQVLLNTWFTSMLQPQALHPWSRLIDANLMAFARQQGCAVNTWTVNDLEEARRLATLGVDVIMSDVPDVMIEGLHG